MIILEKNLVMGKLRKGLMLLLFVVSGTTLFSQVKWKVQEDKWEVKFKINNFFNWVDGTLSGLKADINFDPASPDKGSIKATVDVNTINTGITKRDNHLRSADYFDAANYPLITISSHKIEKISEKEFKMKASVTIRATTQEMTIPFEFGEQNGQGLFHSEFDLNRIDFGVGGRGSTMGETVKVFIHVYVIRQ